MNKSKPEQLRLKLKTNSSKITPHKPPNQKFTEEAKILGKKKKKPQAYKQTIPIKMP